MSFGEKLTKQRKARGMSQEDLASNLNVSRQAVSKWESNNSYPETEKIVAICNLFNCSMDELIGLKEGNVKKENKLIKSFNKYFDQFIKGIKLFYSMTFKQKIKCLIEMAFYSLILVILFLILDIIIIEIIRKLFSLLPNELLFILIQTFRGILLLSYLILGTYVLIKLYKVRYLDYYKDSCHEKEIRDDIVGEDSSKDKIKIKEERIIIRDPGSAFQPYNWIVKFLLYFTKFITLFIVLVLAITFVVLIACIIFILYFVNYGLLILYVILGLIGALVGIYVILEFLIKFIFNMKQSPKKLFFMFIVAMLITGISGGFFACELITYKIVENKEYNTLVYKEEIEMQENLIINFLYYEKVDIIYEERENILVEFYGTDRNISFIDTIQSNINCKNDRREEITQYERYMYYNYHDYINGDTLNDLMQSLLKAIKNKEIVNETVLFTVIPKVHISKENYDKLMKNFNKYESDRELYWCVYE